MSLARTGAFRRPSAWFDGPMNVGQLLANTARRHPDRPAVTWGDRRLDYATFDRRTNALARAFSGLGAVRGDRVGVLMRNRPEMVEAMFACFKGGFCLVPLNSRFTEDEVAYHVGDSGAIAVLTDNDGAEVVLGATAPSRGNVPVVVAGSDDVPDGAHAYDDFVAATDDAPATVSVDRDDLAWLFYTSGTTGRPKGAMLTHGNLRLRGLVVAGRSHADGRARRDAARGAALTRCRVPRARGDGARRAPGDPTGATVRTRGHPRPRRRGRRDQHLDGAHADRDAARSRR